MAANQTPTPFEAAAMATHDANEASKKVLGLAYAAWQRLIRANAEAEAIENASKVYYAALEASEVSASARLAACAAIAQYNGASLDLH